MSDHDGDQAVAPSRRETLRYLSVLGLAASTPSVAAAKPPSQPRGQSGAAGSDRPENPGREPTAQGGRGRAAVVRSNPLHHAPIAAPSDAGAPRAEPGRIGGSDEPVAPPAEPTNVFDVGGEHR